MVLAPDVSPGGFSRGQHRKTPLLSRCPTCLDVLIQGELPAICRSETYPLVMSK